MSRRFLLLLKESAFTHEESYGLSHIPPTSADLFNISQLNHIFGGPNEEILTVGFHSRLGDIVDVYRIWPDSECGI
jgi:hypothetical protein